MKILRLASVLALMCVLPLTVLWHVPLGVATAQGAATAIPITIAPSSITITPPWHQDAALTEVLPEREIIALAGTNDHLLIGYLSAGSVEGDPIAAVLGAYLPVVGTVTDIDRNTRYALQSAQINGVPYGIFSLVYTNRNPGIIEVHVYLAPASTFDTGLASAQANVAVNQAPVFFRVNGRTLQSMIVRQAHPGNASADAALAPPLIVPVPTPAVSPTAAATTAPTPTLSPSPTGEPTIAPTPMPTLAPTPTAEPTLAPTVMPTPAPTTASIPSLATPTPTIASPGTQPIAVNGTPAVSIDTVSAPAAPLRRPGTDVSMYEEAGVSEDGIYASPQFQTRVSWDTRWTVLPSSDETSATSDWISRTDSLFLSSTIYPDAVVIVSIMSAYDFGMDDWTVALNMRDQGQYPTVITDVHAISGTAVLMSADGGTVYMYDVSTSADGSVFREIEVRSSTPVAPEVLAAVIEGIEMEDEPVFQSLAPDDLNGVLP